MGGIVEAAGAVAALKNIRRQLIEEIANIDRVVSDARRMLSGKHPQPVIVEFVRSGDLKGKVYEAIRGGPRSGLTLDEIVIALIGESYTFPENTAEAEWVDLVFRDAVRPMVSAGEIAESGKSPTRYKAATHS